MDVQKAAVLAVQALMEAVRDSPDSGYGECPICLEIMEKPFSTECDHTFCYECIVGLINSNNRSSAGCPMCRRTLTIKNIRPAPQLIAPAPLPVPALAPAPLAQLKAAGGTEGVKVAGVSALMDVVSDDVASDDLNAKAVGDVVAPGVAAGAIAAAAAAAAVAVAGAEGAIAEGGGGEGVVEVAAEEEPLNILGDGLMTTKLRHLVSELRKVQTADSTAKCLVFSQFTQVLKFSMLMRQHAPLNLICNVMLCYVTSCRVMT